MWDHLHRRKPRLREENYLPENLPFLSPITALLPRTPWSVLNTEVLPSRHMFFTHPFPHPRRRVSWMFSWKRDRKEEAGHGRRDGSLRSQKSTGTERRQEQAEVWGGSHPTSWTRDPRGQEGKCSETVSLLMRAESGWEGACSLN